MLTDQRQSAFARVCAHCGASEPTRLGDCDVCGAPVCDRCGNTQHLSGQKKVIHDSCLKDQGGGMFKMIKFVR